MSPNFVHSFVVQTSKLRIVEYFRIDLFSLHDRRSVSVDDDGDDVAVVLVVFILLTLFSLVVAFASFSTLTREWP
jgi:hypothetical protein